MLKIELPYHHTFTHMPHLVFIAMFLCSLSHGNAKKGKNVSPKKIQEIKLVLDGPTTLYGVVPGEKINYDIVIFTKKGKKYSLAEGTLLPDRIEITSAFMEVDESSRTILLEGNRDVLGESNYAIEIFYGKGKHQKRVKKVLIPDFRAIYGPKREEVASLEFALLENPDHRFLIPGKPIKLQVTVFDKGGQRYCTDGQYPKLPNERFVVNTEHVDWDPKQGLLKPWSDKGKLAGNNYRISVTFEGLPHTISSVELVPDFAFYEGPRAEDIEEMGMDVGGTTSGGMIVPGAKIDLEVWVKDRFGRKFYSFGNHVYKLQPNRIQIDGVYMDRLGSNHKWRASDDIAAMLGKSYLISASYKERSDLIAERGFVPDFQEALRPYFAKEHKVDMKGDAVAGRYSRIRQGSGGSYESPGEGGQTNKGLWGKGGVGGHGKSATKGGKGGNGVRGPSIRIKALGLSPIAFPERQCLLIELIEGTEAPKYSLREMHGPTLSVTATGGSGGHGGTGGSGGDGGTGGKGYHTGTGGNGGNGGPGGDGGNGGSGGTISFMVSSRDLTAFFLLEVPGGAAGQAGNGGRAGRGGRAGKQKNYHKEAAKSGTPPQVRVGKKGRNGVNGKKGLPGEPGPDGSIKTEVLTPSAQARLWKRIPLALRRQLSKPKGLE